MTVPKLKFNINYLLLTTLLLWVEILIAINIKSGFIRHTFGDFLVVILMHCAFRAITSLSIKFSAILSLCIAFCVEFLQLTPILEWLGLAENQLARVIFGTQFSFSDLLAYTLGVLTILIIELKLCKH